MILINLLPHREEKRRQRKRAFFASLGAFALAGAAVALVWYSVLQQMTAAQEARNAFLQAEIARLDSQIKDIATLRAEIEALKARQKAVEDLQTDRNVPVHLLNELVKQTPEGVYLTSIKQNGRWLPSPAWRRPTSACPSSCATRSTTRPGSRSPELVEIKVATLTASNREQRRLFDFSMRVNHQAPAAALAAAFLEGAIPAGIGARGHRART